MIEHKYNYTFKIIQVFETKIKIIQVFAISLVSEIGIFSEF